MSNTNKPGNIIFLSQLTNGKGYHRDDTANLTPWGHAPRVFPGWVTAVLLDECGGRAAASPPLKGRLPRHEASKGRFSRHRNFAPTDLWAAHAGEQTTAAFWLFGNLRGRNAQSDVEKAGRGSMIPRKFLLHHVTFSKSARISHHEPTAQRLLPTVWGVTTSQELASGMESRGLTAACSIASAASTRHVDSELAELCFKCRHA